jgi:hypothetical protein
LLLGDASLTHVTDEKPMMDFLLALVCFVATGFAVSSTIPQINKAQKTRLHFCRNKCR